MCLLLYFILMPGTSPSYSNWSLSSLQMGRAYPKQSLRYCCSRFSLLNIQIFLQSCVKLIFLSSKKKKKMSAEYLDTRISAHSRFAAPLLHRDDRGAHFLVLPRESASSSHRGRSRSRHSQGIRWIQFS